MAGMHPPSFRVQQLLSDWPDCVLELRCPGCERMTQYPVRMLRGEHGDLSFEKLLPRLRCKDCRVKPAPVYLCASYHRVFLGGPPPDWAVLLVPTPEPTTSSPKEA